jgi:hypothetical protein
MSQILEWLARGDLRTDGDANEVAAFILKNTQLLEDLVAALFVEEDPIRGHAADALEKVSRARPREVVDFLPQLLTVARSDRVPMVRWHAAMVLGHLAMFEDHVPEITATLLSLLEDDSVFVKSWAIVSLCIIGRKYPREVDRIVSAIAPMKRDASIAIRSKVRNAMSILTLPEKPFPKGWIKSEHLQGM